MQDRVDIELNRLLSWDLADLRKVLKGVEALIRQREGEQPLHKAREFRGISSGTWKDVDVDEYIKQERASWES